MKKAVKSAAEYNSMFMKEKREERRAYFDLQTNVSFRVNLNADDSFWVYSGSIIRIVL